jgi:hypothetical protein
MHLSTWLYNSVQIHLKYMTVKLTADVFQVHNCITRCNVVVTYLAAGTQESRTAAAIDSAVTVRLRTAPRDVTQHNGSLSREEC